MLVVDAAVDASSQRQMLDRMPSGGVVSVCSHIDVQALGGADRILKLELVWRPRRQ